MGNIFRIIVDSEHLINIYIYNFVKLLLTLQLLYFFE